MLRLFLIPILIAAPATLLAQAHQVCSNCHGSQTEDFKKHKHFTAKLSCDACHGASKSHAESQGMVTPEKVTGPMEQAALCGACHAEQAKGYSASAHGKAVQARSEKRAAYCTMCHGNHALRAYQATEQQCNRCHADLPASCKQAPPATAARVSCANCHHKHTLAAKKE
jgi:hypothetical protein